MVVSGIDIDMRRHVDQVPGPGHQSVVKHLSTCQCSLWKWRSLHDMDIIMMSSRMMGVHLNGLLDDSHDIRRPWPGLAILLP